MQHTTGTPTGPVNVERRDSDIFKALDRAKPVATGLSLAFISVLVLAIFLGNGNPF